MSRISLGIQLWAQNTEWAPYLEAAKLVDELGYDHLWTWDHLVSAVGDPNGSVFEGYTTLAAWAMATRRVKLGLLVGANTFRNPTITAKTISTIDHISGGRAIMGLGGAWHTREHAAFGVEIGSGFGERLAWLEEALQIIRPLLHGEEVTHDGPRYRVDHLRLNPPPVQARMPIMVGGSGERMTLRSVARHADMWNAQSPLEGIPRKLEALWGHCDAEGRDPSTIELTYDCRIIIRDRHEDAQAVLEAQCIANTIDPKVPDHSLWAGTVEGIAERLSAFRDLGFRTFTIEELAPFDRETLVRLIGEVKPLLERG